MVRKGGALAAALTGLALLWAPVPFGSVTATAEAALDGAGFVLLALALTLTAGWVGLGRATGPAAALALLALLGIFQSAPLPTGWVETLSPEHGRLYREAAEVLRPEDPTPRPSLSLAPAVSRRSALSYLAVAAWLLVGALLSRRWARRGWGAALLAAAAFEGLYGFRRWMARDLTIWGREVPDSAGRLRGTFVNPDHLATYFLIALAVCFAWGWWALRAARRSPTLELRLVLLVPPAVAWLVFFVGIAFTGSRAALVAALGGTLAQALLAVWGGWGPRRPRRADGERGRRREAVRKARVGVAAGLAVLVVGLGVVAWVGYEQGLGRLLGTSSFELSTNVRFVVYDQTLDLWQRFPLWGSGLGTFRDAYPLIQPRSVGGTWAHAHSDPLELLLTTGLVGTLIAFGGVLALLYGLLRSLGRGLRTEDRAAALAALGAVAAVAAQECLDFGLTLPANAMTLAVLCGAALGVERRRLERPDPEQGLTEPRDPAPG